MDNNKNIEICFQECEKMLWKLADKYKSIYNGDKEEAFANASLWLVEDYNGYNRDKASFVTYIYMCIEKRFIKAMNKFYDEKEYICGTDLDDLDELGLLSTDNIDYQLIDDEMTDGKKNRYDIYFEYKDYLDIFKEKDKEIFRLYYYCGRNEKEIAEIYDLNERSIRKIKEKILKKVKNIKKNEENQ